MKNRSKLRPRYVTIVRPLSPISWFNHWIGETFEVHNISEYNSVEIEYMEGRKGWVPLECCEIHYFRPSA